MGELDFNISTNGTKAGVLSGENINFDPSLGFEFGYVGKVFLRFGLGNMQTVINQTNTSPLKQWFLGNNKFIQYNKY